MVWSDQRQIGKWNRQRSRDSRSDTVRKTARTPCRRMVVGHPEWIFGVCFWAIGIPAVVEAPLGYRDSSRWCCMICLSRMRRANGPIWWSCAHHVTHDTRRELASWCCSADIINGRGHWCWRVCRTSSCEPSPSIIMNALFPLLRILLPFFFVVTRHKCGIPAAKVSLTGPVHRAFKQGAETLEIEEEYINPGPCQFAGCLVCHTSSVFKLTNEKAMEKVKERKEKLNDKGNKVTLT